MAQQRAIAYTSIMDTPTDLGTHFPGHVAVTLDPQTLWVNTATGWVAVGTPSGDAPPSPASEAGPGTVELAPKEPQRWHGLPASRRITASDGITAGRCGLPRTAMPSTVAELGSTTIPGVEE